MNALEGKGDRTRGVWSIERQVRLLTSVIILISVALACTANPSWILLTCFVALGMMFSAIFNSLGLVSLLEMMPWNRNANASASCKKNS